MAKQESLRPENVPYHTSVDLCPIARTTTRWEYRSPDVPRLLRIKYCPHQQVQQLQSASSETRPTTPSRRS